MWDYLLHACDHAGIWKVDLDLASFCIGEEYSPKEILDIFKDKIHIISPEKWFIPKFVEFQYGDLNKDIRCHQSVITLLKKEGILKGLTNPLLTLKDKDKDKDKNKDKDIRGARGGNRGGDATHISESVKL